MVSALVMGISTHPLRIWQVAVFMILPQVSGVLMVLFIPFMFEYGEYSDNGNDNGGQDACRSNQSYCNETRRPVGFDEAFYEPKEC